MSNDAWKDVFDVTNHFGTINFTESKQFFANVFQFICHSRLFAENRWGFFYSAKNFFNNQKKMKGSKARRNWR